MSHMALAVGENDSPSFLLTWREWTKAQCKPHHICKGGPSPTAMLPPLNLSCALILLKKKKEWAGTWVAGLTLFMHESIFKLTVVWGAGISPKSLGPFPWLTKRLGIEEVLNKYLLPVYSKRSLPESHTVTRNTSYISEGWIWSANKMNSFILPAACTSNAAMCGNAAVRCKTAKPWFVKYGEVKKKKSFKHDVLLSGSAHPNMLVLIW